MPSRWRRMRAARLTKAEQRDPFLALGGEDQPEQILEQVAGVERLVERFQGGELLLLPVGQVLGVPQQREASPVDDLRRVLLAALPRGVPDAAPHLVQGLGSSGHGMERVDAQHGVRAPLPDDRAYPGRRVGAHMGQHRDPLRPQLVDARRHGLLVAVLPRPDDSPGPGVDHDRAVRVALAVVHLSMAMRTKPSRRSRPFFASPTTRSRIAPTYEHPGGKRPRDCYGCQPHSGQEANRIKPFTSIRTSAGSV